MRIDAEIYNFKSMWLWVIIAVLYGAISYLSNLYLYSDSFYYNSLSDRFDVERITKVILLQRRLEVVAYLLIPILLLLKIWTMSGIIYMGIFLANKYVPYVTCLKVVLLAELVFVIAAVTRLVWLVIDVPANAEELQYFSPLSITQLLNFDHIPKYLFYPLQLMNVFEGIYWLALAYGIAAVSRTSFKKSFNTITLSYGLALVAWVVFIVFLQVQFT